MVFLCQPVVQLHVLAYLIKAVSDKLAYAQSTLTQRYISLLEEL